MNLRKAMMAGCAAAALMAPGAAMALTTPPQTDTFAPQTPTFTDSLIFSQYNPAVFGAPLGSIHITLSGTAVTGPGNVHCFAVGGDGKCRGSVDSQITMTLSGPSSGPLAVVIPLTTFSYVLTGTGATTTIPMASMTKTDVVLIAPPTVAELADFSGAGNVTLTLTALKDVITHNNDGTAGVVQPVVGSGSAQIFYDYSTTTTPEPSTLAALGVGLAGLGLYRRRRRGSQTSS